jgi:hypothetical protein
MDHRLTGALVACLITLSAATARAQEGGQAGVVMGYPATIGFIWHASDSVALRPEFNYTRSTTDREPNIGGISGSTTHTTSAGLGVLWYLGRYDSVRTYFSPRVLYSHGSSSAEGVSGSSSGNAVSVSGAFGAQYTPVRRFGVFGEIGYSFNRGTSKSDASFGPVSKSINRAWASRAAVGAVFYFGG